MLEIKKFPVEMPFPGRGWFLYMPFYIQTPDRLDKLRSALAEARLQIKILSAKMVVLNWGIGGGYPAPRSSTATFASRAGF